MGEGRGVDALKVPESFFGKHLLIISILNINLLLMRAKICKAAFVIVDGEHDRRWTAWECLANVYEKTRKKGPDI